MLVCFSSDLTRRSQAYDLLARGAREHWGLSSLPPIARQKQGKPFFPTRPELHFNLSHSGPYALCALDGAAMGVDIQRVTAHRPGLLQRCCCPRERAWLTQRGDSWEAFTLLWAMKEALVKESGRGLTVPLSSICPPLPAGAETLLEQDGLWFRLYAGPDWRGAVCGRTPPPEFLHIFPLSPKNTR